MTGDGNNTIIISELTGTLKNVVKDSDNHNSNDTNTKSLYLLFARLYPVNLLILYLKIYFITINKYI